MLSIKRSRRKNKPSPRHPSEQLIKLATVVLGFLVALINLLRILVS